MPLNEYDQIHEKVLCFKCNNCSEDKILIASESDITSNSQIIQQQQKL